MTWDRRIRKTVIISFVVGLALLVLTEFSLPLIYEFLWQLPASPSKSLEGILARRIELRNLETELNVLLYATSHPVNDHGIAGQNELSQQFSEYFAMVEDYTQRYGKLEHADFDRFVRIHEEVSKKYREFANKDKELDRESRKFLAGLDRRVLDTADTTNIKSTWTLLRQFDQMKEFGMQLDQMQHQVDVEIANLGLVSNSEDEACIEVLQKLSKLLNKADDVSMRMKLIRANELEANRSDKSLSPEHGTTNVAVNIELEQLLQRSSLIRTEMIELFMANKKLLGKTFLFINAAIARVRDLVNQVGEKEDVWREEMNSAREKLRDMVHKTNRLQEDLLLNMKLRIAPDLDQEL